MNDQVQGLSVKLNFDETQAIEGMQKTSSTFSVMNAKISGAKAGFAQVQKGLSTLGIGGIIASVGIAGSIRKYTAFDEVMANVRATLGEGAKKDFPILENAARSMAADTGKNIITVAEAMSALATDTNSTTKTIELLKPVLTGMTISGMDAGSMSRILKESMNKFGISTKNATGILDTFVVASRIGTVKIPEFSSALVQLGGVASLLGVPMSDTAAVLAAFTRSGLDAQSSASTLRIAMMKLSKASKSGWINIAGLGQVQVATKNGALDLETTLFNVSNAFSRSSDSAKKSKLAIGLFGLRGNEAASAIERITKNPGELSNIFKTIQAGSSGAAESMAKLKIDSAAGRMNKLKNALSNVSVEIGSAFVPFIVKGSNEVIKFAQGLSKAFNFFFANPEAITKTGVAIDGVTGSATAFAQGFTAGIQNITRVFGFLFDSINVIGGVFSGGKSMGGGTRFMVKWAVQVGAVATAYKVLGPVIKSAMNIGIGTAKMLGGVLSSVGTGTTGLIGLMSKKIPFLAKVLPKGFGILGKAASSFEKIIAQPVRIVNWNEAVGLGGPMSPKKTQFWTGPESQLSTGTTPKSNIPLGRRGIGAGVKFGGASSAIMALGGGLALNMISGEGAGAVKTLGNSFLGLSMLCGPAGMAVGGVTTAALALGNALDNYTGLSTLASDAMFDIYKNSRNVLTRAAISSSNYKGLQEQANTLFGFANRGVKVQTAEGGRTQVTAEFMRSRLVALAGKTEGVSQEQAKLWVSTIMEQMTPKLAEAMKNVSVNAQLNVDGRPVARGVANATQENKARRGETQKAGVRRKAASL